MSESEQKDQETGKRPTETRRPPPASLANLRPWRKGQSGNPSGLRNRAVIARLAGRHTEKAVLRVSELLDHSDPAIRLKAAQWLAHQAYGAPPTSQTVVQPTQVNVIGLGVGGPGMSVQTGQQGLSPAQAYRLMCEGIIEATGDHPAFKPALEHKPEADSK